MNFIHDRNIAVEEESLSDLVKDLRDEVVVMIRQQVELAKTETSEKIASIGKKSALVAAGASILYAGFLVLLAGLSFLTYAGLLALDVAPIYSIWIAPLIVGAIVTAIGGIMAYRYFKSVKNTSPVPEKMVHTLKEDQLWLKKKIH